MEGISIPCIHLCHLQNHNYYIKMSPPGNLTSLRPSGNEKSTFQRGAAVHQTYPFCQSVLEEKLMPWPCVLHSQPFWEAIHTASPYPYQILPVSCNCMLLANERPHKHGSTFANTVSQSIASGLFP